MNKNKKIDRFGTTARYADATVFNGMAYAVEVPAMENGDIATQMESLLASLERTLKSVGSDKDRLLMATIYLVDMADYDGMNRVWESWLPQAAAPSRACVKVAGLARTGWRVEIAVTATVA